MPTIAVLAASIAVLLLVTNVVLGAAWSAGGDEQLGKFWSLAWVGFPVVGAVIAAKRPGTRVGWLLVAAGLAVGLSQIGGTWALRALHTAPGSLPGGEIALLLVGLETTGFALLAFALLYFPHDRLPSARWRLPAGVAAGAVVASTVASLLTYRVALYVGEGRSIWVDIPFAVASVGRVADVVVWVAGSTAGAFAVVVLLTLVVRAVLSRGVERQQMKWLGYIAALFAAFLVLIPLEMFAVIDLSPMVETLVAVAAFVICFNGFAAAIGVAVLRYRLYDIDRVASRTVTYLAVTATSVAVYTLTVLGLTRSVHAVSGGDGGDLIVAASTLAVAALFGPLRSRVQSTVDRHFNRASYDAVGTVESFSHRLRDELDPDAIAGHLHGAAATAVQPRLAGVWLLQR